MDPKHSFIKGLHCVMFWLKQSSSRDCVCEQHSSELVRLSICAGLSEPRLLFYALSTKNTLLWMQGVVLVSLIFGISHIKFCFDKCCLI